MALLAPPVGDHAIRKDDQVAPVLAAIDDDATEAVVLEQGDGLIVSQACA
jgi:hypothetical protein